MVDHADDYGVQEQPFRLRQRAWRPSSRLTRRARRLCFAMITFIISVAFFLAAACGILFLRLSGGPMAVAALDAPVLAALSSKARPGFHIGIDGVDVEAVDGKPAIAVRQLLVRDEEGHTVFRAPRAVISVDPLRLITGAIVPTRLDVSDVTLKLSILPDGSAALSAGSDDTLPLLVTDALGAATPASDAHGDVLSPEPVASAGAAAGPSNRFAASVAALIDKVTDLDHALGGLDRFGVDNGTLTLDDRTHDTVTSFRRLDIDFQKVADGASRLMASADGAGGRWSFEARAMREADARRTLTVDVENVMLDDLRAIPGARDLGFDADVPLTANATLGLDASGALAVARGRVSAGSGFFRLHDPDYEPYLIDAISASFHLDGDGRRIVIDPSNMKADTSSYEMSGEVIPPQADGDPWTATLAGKGVFGGERPGEKPLALERIDFSARAFPSQHRFSIEKFDIAGPQVALGLHADIQAGDAGLLVKGGATSGRMPTQAMLRIWPTAVAAEVRAWLLVNLQAGMVDHGAISFALDDADLAKMRTQHSVADGHLRVDYSVSDLTLAFMGGVPPLKVVSGTGVVTGDTSKFIVKQGTLDVAKDRQLSLADGSLVVPSTDPKPAPATITAHVLGGVDVLTDLLSRDALKPYANLPPDLGTPKGQIDGTLTVGLKLGKGASPNDVKVGATAQISDLVIEKLVGKQNLTDGQIGLVLDKTGLRIKGDARLFDAPTAIDVKKPAGTAPGEANAVLTLDDAARVKAGMSFGRGLTGPITAKVTTVLGGTDQKAVLDVDLAKATINNIVPGLSKASGKPGRVTLSMAAGDGGVALSNIACDIGSFSLRGSANLDSNGGFQAAHLSQVRLSPGDDMKAEATQGSDGLKLVVRAANLDARPFLKSLMASESGAPDAGAKDIDLDLHANVMTGQNSQAMTAVDLRMMKRDAQLRRLQVSGKFGRAPFEIKSGQQGRDLVLTATSADSGATLAFLDLYKKVSGGKLDTTIHLADNKFDGYATIHGFTLREDPAMTQLTEEGISQEKPSDVRIDTSNLAFTKLYVLFSKAGSRVDIKDGGMFGTQMGATVQGWIDLAHDRIQLNGTYVPAYGVNNLFSQIPVVGPILGGGTHEGLFGINYKITGSVGSPNLSVDPLSALAPGFLRKIFGAISEASEEDGAPTPQRTTKPVDRQAR